MMERSRALASVVVVVLVLGGCYVAVAAAPAPADVTGGDPPDYVLEEDGTVVIDGDLATDCRSFAGGVPPADADPDLEQAQRVLEQCEQAGLLPSKSTTSSASASSEVSAVDDGEGGGLPDTGGPGLAALLVVSSALAVASGLLVRKVAAE